MRVSPRPEFLHEYGEPCHRWIEFAPAFEARCLCRRVLLLIQSRVAPDIPPGASGSARCAGATAVPEKPIARRYLVSGMVQGVGFRFYAQRAAERLGLSGYVMNRHDGRVEVYAIGEPGPLQELMIELRQGPRGASVSDVTEEEVAVVDEYAGSFSIEHDSW